MTQLAECPLNDIGALRIQFAMFCFGGERPDHVHIEGLKDQALKCDSGNITLLFRGGRGKAYLAYSKLITKYCF